MLCYASVVLERPETHTNQIETLIKWFGNMSASTVVETTDFTMHQNYKHSQMTKQSEVSQMDFLSDFTTHTRLCTTSMIFSASFCSYKLHCKLIKRAAAEFVDISC